MAMTKTKSNKNIWSLNFKDYELVTEILVIVGGSENMRPQAAAGDN